MTGATGFTGATGGTGAQGEKLSLCTMTRLRSIVAELLAFCSSGLLEDVNARKFDSLGATDVNLGDFNLRYSQISIP